MNSRVLSLLGLLFFILSACSSSSDSDGGGGSVDAARVCGLVGLNARVINGVTCSGAAPSGIVRYVTYDARGDITGFCSGSMIAPDVVLTATHCFLDQDTVGALVLAGEGDRIETAEAVQLAIAPGFRLGGAETSNRLFNDVAILRLERRFSAQPLPILLSRAPVVGEEGFVYGYGSTRVGASPDTVSIERLQGGSMTIREVTPNHIFVTFDGSGVNVCSGDSGGPIVVDIGGQPAIAGVTSQGSNRGCQSGDVTTFTNLQSDSVLSWLGSEVPLAGIR